MTTNELRELLVKATEIAWKAHARVKDKAGAPYIGHPMRVAQRCENDAERIVAMLHDTLEDTPITADDLRRDGFTDELVAAVESVTRNPGESYRDFIARSARNEIGRRVKLHDLEDNMDVTRFRRDLTERDLAHLNKYLHSHHYLTMLDPAELEAING